MLYPKMTRDLHPRSQEVQEDQDNLNLAGDNLKIVGTEQSDLS